MSFSDALSVAYTQTPGAQVVSSTITLVGDTQENLDVNATVGPNVLTNAAINLIKADIQSLLLTCDQNIMLYTNNPLGSTPQDTLNITANVPYVWTVNTGTVFSCPFSNNVTKVFVNNTVNVNAQFKLRSILNNQGKG